MRASGNDRSRMQHISVSTNRLADAIISDCRDVVVRWIRPSPFRIIRKQTWPLCRISYNTAMSAPSMHSQRRSVLFPGIASPTGWNHVVLCQTATVFQGYNMIALWLVHSIERNTTIRTSVFIGLKKVHPFRCSKCTRHIGFAGAPTLTGQRSNSFPMFSPGIFHCPGYCLGTCRFTPSLCLQSSLNIRTKFPLALSFTSLCGLAIPFVSQATFWGFLPRPGSGTFLGTSFVSTLRQLVG